MAKVREAEALQPTEVRRILVNRKMLASLLHRREKALAKLQRMSAREEVLCAAIRADVERLSPGAREVLL